MTTCELIRCPPKVATLAKKGGQVINCHVVIELTLEFVQNTFKIALS